MDIYDYERYSSFSINKIKKEIFFVPLSKSIHTKWLNKMMLAEKIKRLREQCQLFRKNIVNPEIIV
jgi:hypothetical protein